MPLAALAMTPSNSRLGVGHLQRQLLEQVIAYGGLRWLRVAAVAPLLEAGRCQAVLAWQS